MKTNNRIINNYATALLSVVYVLVTLMYIFTMPPNTHLSGQSGSLFHSVLSKANSSGTAGNLLHRGVRTTIESKVKIVVPATIALVLLFSFLFGKLALLNLAKRSSRYDAVFYAAHPDVWLSLRTIRI